MHQVAVLLGNHKLPTVSLMNYISWQNCLFPLSNIVNVDKYPLCNKNSSFLEADSLLWTALCFYNISVIFSIYTLVTVYGFHVCMNTVQSQ